MRDTIADMLYEVHMSGLPVTTERLREVSRTIERRGGHARFFADENPDGTLKVFSAGIDPPKDKPLEMTMRWQPHHEETGYCPGLIFKN